MLPVKHFAKHLRAPGLSVIAEIKRASPSKGKFPVEIDVPSLAAEYAEGGAAAISVLTDEPFFLGSLDDLRVASSSLRESGFTTPLLRKDFVLDEYQMLEAVVAGASAVLLIVAALSQNRLVELLTTATALGLAVLVEVHDETEADRAVNAGASVIGINNRDLKTFAVDLAVSERVAACLAGSATLVAESGIGHPADAARMVDAGVDAILVGETLVLAQDRIAMIRSLRIGASPDDGAR